MRELLNERRGHHRLVGAQLYRTDTSLGRRGDDHAERRLHARVADRLSPAAVAVAMWRHAELAGPVFVKRSHRSVPHFHRRLGDPRGLSKGEAGSLPPKGASVRPYRHPDELVERAPQVSLAVTHRRRERRDAHVPVHLEASTDLDDRTQRRIGELHGVGATPST